MKFFIPALALAAGPAVAIGGRWERTGTSWMSIPKPRTAFCCNASSRNPPCRASWPCSKNTSPNIPRRLPSPGSMSNCSPSIRSAMQWDRVLATAEALLAVDPNDLDSAHDALKAAEAQNNHGPDRQVCRAGLGSGNAYPEDAQACRSRRRCRLEQAHGFRARELWTTPNTRSRHLRRVANRRRETRRAHAGLAATQSAEQISWL